MEMRRKDRMLGTEDTLDILRAGEYGILATVSAEGVPYGVPVSYAYEDGVLYIHCARHDGHKILNIKNNNKVSFTVVGETKLLPEQFATKYMSAIVFGRAELAENNDKRHGLEAIVKKYSPEYVEAGFKYLEDAIDRVYVIKITVDEIVGKGRR